MCGIFGAFALGSRAVLDPSRAEAAIAELGHRGPDGRRTSLVNGVAVLSHARLSIIDLSDEASQPFTVNDRFSVIFNGEIFNYKEIREDLKKVGHSFRTGSDTEVLLHSYMEWGESCVQRFNGMWAFAILDRSEKVLFCSRDRFGEKPFNYAISGDTFVFASEVKAILRYGAVLARPNARSIANYIRTSLGAQLEDTWFDGVFRLAPGMNLTIRSGRIHTSRFWHYPDPAEKIMPFGETCEHYRALFEDSVRLRLRSDVPLGITLSGGIDSSSIACVMQEISGARHHAYTMGFDSRDYRERELSVYAGRRVDIDESVRARRLASLLNLESVVLNNDYSGLVHHLHELIWHLESGNSSPAALPLYHLMKRAKADVSVVLEGQGADELMGGYITRMLVPAIQDVLREGAWREALSHVREYKKSHSLQYAALMYIRDSSNDWRWLGSAYRRQAGVESLLGSEFRNTDCLLDFPSFARNVKGSMVTRALTRQHSGGLVNLLHYGDSVSMAHGVESRNPFLDHRLVEFVWPLPAKYKVSNGVGKSLHRKALEGKVPDFILEDKAKIGFTTPIGSRFKEEESGDEVSPVGVLLSRRCLTRGVFEARGLRRILDEHFSGKREHGNLLYRLLSVELWFRRFVDAAA